MFIATLIAADRLTRDRINLSGSLLEEAGIDCQHFQWVQEGSAADLYCDVHADDALRIRPALEGKLGAVDVVVQAESHRRRKLLVADMDSTMITIECIDELADYAGRKAEVAEVTERAMRGELPFEAALRERVALLKDLDEAAIARCRSERLQIMPGAKVLVRTMRRQGAECLLVSGGFVQFANEVAEQIGFSRAVANTFGIQGGKLDGSVTGPIVGAEAKRVALIDAAAESGIDLADTLAVGDGANDIPMLEAAGLGVAYRAKPKAAAAADARIDHCDLSALLYAQGYPRSEWEED